MAWALVMPAITPAAPAQRTWADLPGVKIDYRKSPAFHRLATKRIFSEPQVYIGSPSIAILPDGTYVAAHDFFGKGSAALNVTPIFRSTDRGRTWTQVATVPEQHSSSLFTYGGALYLCGYGLGGPADHCIIIRRSNDGGTTWSPGSILFSGHYGGTPNTPAFFRDRVYIGVSTRQAMCTIANPTDLLDPAQWVLGKPAAMEGNPWGNKFTYATESQIVAKEGMGVYILPKLHQLPFTALVQVGENDAQPLFDASAPRAFASLPGAEKKFGAQYDPVADKFYALTNPVLPAHAGYTTPALTRNAAAILSSKDLVNWDVEKFFLYSPRIECDAWHYFNFAFDGEDLAVVSRTAFDIGEHIPPRGHDSNLLTFHRIPRFRGLAPSFFLRIEQGVVNRYESTDFRPALLGRFALGAAKIEQPEAIAQDTVGHIYLRQANGAILKFDLSGNLEGVSERLPANVTWKTGDVAIDPPLHGRRAWIKNTGGDWGDPLNWLYWGRPDTNAEVAVFGTAATADATITMNQHYTLKGLCYPHSDLSSHNYSITGTGGITLAAEAGNAWILNAHGRHTISVPITLARDADVTVRADQDPEAKLTFNAPVKLNGRTLRVCGTGLVTMGGALNMSGGRLVLDGLRPLTFTRHAAGSVLDGTFELAPATGLSLARGATFRLLDGVDQTSGRFKTLALPALGENLAWDSSRLYTDGTVRVISAGPAAHVTTRPG